MTQVTPLPTGHATQNIMVHLEEILKHQRKFVSKMLKLTQQRGHQATRRVGGRGEEAGTHQFTSVLGDLQLLLETAKVRKRPASWPGLPSSITLG